MKVINKPGTSEHNLGLAVDFNYVNNDFENTESYKWLKENAKKYGSVLRYPKDKGGLISLKSKAGADKVIAGEGEGVL